MTDASDLFEAVKVAYDNDGLVTLTNIRDRSATTLDETVGDNTAQSVIDLWPAYTQVAYDSSNALHVEVAIEAVIGLLWKRGGTSSSIAEVRWTDVVEMFDRVKMTGPRGHRPITTNGPDKDAAGNKLRPWSSRKAMPPGYLPIRAIDDGT